MTVLEVVGVVLMFGGTLFACVAGLGILRFPDVYMRLHASTKAGTLGVALNAAAMVAFYPSLGIFTRALALILFVLLTAPVAAHMIGRASYFGQKQMGVSVWEETIVDQMMEHRGSSLFPSEDGDESPPVDVSS